MIVIFWIFSLISLPEKKWVVEHEDGTVDATWISNDLHGRTMADGAPYHKGSFYICACNYYPLGTRLNVHFDEKFIQVKVCDKTDEKTYIDIAPNLFRILAPLEEGRIRVRIVEHQ